MTIGVLICGLIFDSQKKIVQGIKKCAREKSCNVFVFTCMGDVFITNDYSKGEFSIFSLPDFSNLDGVILVGNTIMYDKTVEEIVEKIIESKIPAISVDNKFPGLASIFSDNKKSMEDMVNHLIHAHKKSKIMFLAGPSENIESQERLKGYLYAMEKANIDVKPNWYLFQDFTEKAGEIAAEYFIDSASNLPEAIVCANDIMAISLANALKKRQIKIPETIIITGYDNSFGAQLFGPQISSVDRFQDETGYKALEYLIDVIEQKEPLKKNIETRYELILSSSCGCNELIKYENNHLKEIISKQKLKSNSEIMNLKNLYTKSISINQHADFFKILEKHFSGSFFKQFYLCMKSVNKKEDTDTYCYSKNSVLNIAIKDKKNIENYKNLVFPTKDILPKEIIEDNEPFFLYVLPIHAIEHTLGYVVVDSYVPLESELFYTVILNIGLLYENIKNKVKLKTTVEKLDELWIQDALTGLYNRNGFMKHAREMIKECIHRDTNLLVLFADIDNLKYVNDNFGHFEGDSYIVSMSKILLDSDFPIKLLMRYGGDEFVLFSPDHSEESVEKHISNITDSIKTINNVANKAYKMDISIGYILKKITDQDKAENLIALADEKMYINKNSKKQTKNL